MFSRSLLLVLLLCGLNALSMAHNPSFLPSGWSGPTSGGGTSSSHPENLCKNFTTYACMVGGINSFGYGLGNWPVYVTNSAGESFSYSTNNGGTKGWIVVIGVTGRGWSYSAPPGSHDGKVCQIMTPSAASGLANTAYGTSRYYYQATINGSFGGTLCAGLP